MDTEEIIKENESLKAKVQNLESRNEALDDDNDDLKWQISDLQDEVWNLEDEIEALKNAPLWQKFNEIFEFYNCIWSDETKDKQLIEAMKRLHSNQAD